MKIWRERVTEFLNAQKSDNGVCRSAPATPGLLYNVEIAILILLIYNISNNKCEKLLVLMTIFPII